MGDPSGPRTIWRVRDRADSDGGSARRRPASAGELEQSMERAGVVVRQRLESVHPRRRVQHEEFLERPGIEVVDGRIAALESGCSEARTQNCARNASRSSCVGGTTGRSRARRGG